MGRRVALQTLSPNIVNYLALNNQVSLAEVKIINKKFIGKSLAELAIREKFGITVIAISRNDNVDVSPMPSEVILAGDTLAVVGATEQVTKFNKATD